MQSTFAHLRQLLTFIPPRDADERAYVRTWLLAHHQDDIEGLYKLSFLFNGIGLLSLPLARFGDLLKYRAIIHVAMTIITIGWLAWARHRPGWMRPYALVTEYLYAGLFAGILWYRVRFEADSFDTNTIPGLYAALIVYLTILCPYTNIVRTLTAALYWLMALSAMRGFPNVGMWMGVVSVGLLGALLFSASFTAAQRTEAVQEYRARLLIAPRTIVRALAGTRRHPEDAFTPEPRACVCISVDWQDQEKLAATPQALASLDVFYTRCDLILRRTLEDGNYYVDWFAGELFVVVFAPDTDLPRGLADAALDAAQQLAAGYDPRSLLQIGLAAGIAHIGLMGPAGCRKATAIGEVAGRARRVLSAASMVMERTGGGHPVLFGDDLRTRLTRPWPYALLSLPAAGLRDLDDEMLYFLHTTAVNRAEPAA